jgi:hypothetical protein
MFFPIGLDRRFARQAPGAAHCCSSFARALQPSLRAQRSNPALNDKLIASQARAQLAAANFAIPAAVSLALFA